FVSWPTPPRRLKPKRPCLRRSEHVSSFTSLWTEVYLPLDDSPVKRVGSPTRTPPECGYSKGRSGGVSGTLRCGRYEGYYEGSIQKTPGRASGSSRNVRHNQPVRHARLEMLEYAGLSSRHADRQRLAVCHPKLDDV